MKKTITALLLSLVTVLCLTAVAWATGLPPAPSKDDIMKLAKVKVSCVDNIDASAPKEGPHQSRIYDLVESAFTTESSKVEQLGGPGSTVWTYTFRLTNRGTDQYIYQFQQDTRYAHDRSVHFTDFTLTYDGNIGEWQMENNGIIEIKVSSCSTVAMPDAAPSPELLKTGKVIVLCRDHQQHESEFSLAPGTYPTDETSMYYWNASYNNTGAWFYGVYLRTPAQGNEGISHYVNPFNQKYGKHLITGIYGMIPFIYQDNTTGWKLYQDKESGYIPAIYIETISPPTVAELNGLLGDLNVSVQCTKHAEKAYDKANLLANTSLDFTPVWNSAEYRYEYKVTLTDAAADSYVADYSTAVGKTHTRKDNTSDVTIYWHEILISSLSPTNDPTGGEITPPDIKWKLVKGSGTTLTVNATCDTTTTPPGGTGGGFPFKDSNKTTTTVTSPKTFDAGMAVYAGLAILSLTGSAMVIRKKEF